MDRARLYRRFRTLLIANRGEIACRVIRTARAMGLRTVAVYSEADRDAMHVAEADEAVLLGPARARDSYLNIERVIEAARKSGAEAVHPGYGFLSENAEFALACADAGLVFVGPTPDMMTAMGSKSGSKALMEKAGVPLVPGYHGEAQDEATLAKAADAIGFPVLVKASAGGGGRGMRIVRSAAELAPAIVSAKREAKAAFGDDRMLIERYVQNPRHIEVQVIGDSHGNLLSLFERECTLQTPPSEGDRGSAVADARRRPTRSRLRRRAQGRGRGELCRRRHHRIRLRRQGRVLHRDEYPAAGRASRHRTDHGDRSRRVAVAGRVRREAAADAGRDHASWPRHRGREVYAENPDRNFMPSVGRIRDLAHAGSVERPEDRFRIPRGRYRVAALRRHAGQDDRLAPTRDAAIERLNNGLEAADVRGVVTNIRSCRRW